MKPIIIVALFLLACVQGAAQTQAETEYVFRFVPGRDAFYVPFRGNGAQLDSLASVISSGMEQLKNGERYIAVTSYGSSTPGSARSERRARIRRLRVKSELIDRCGVTEEMFVTDRNVFAPYKDYLDNVVVVVIPAPVDKVEAIAGPEAAARVRRYIQSCAAPAVEETEQPEDTKPIDVDSAETVLMQECEIPEPDTGATDIHKRSQSLSLRANLLRWATLTPDLGIEWRISRSFGIAVNGSWTSWSWDDKARRYALWEVAPEVRYYIGDNKRGYIGAMYKAGEFNYKLSATGRQGKIMGGGITGGYQLRLNNALSVDFSLGLGYLRADSHRYIVVDGVRVRQDKAGKNWWGPASAGVTLVWTIFK